MTDMANTLARGSSNATPLGHHSIFPVPCCINESGYGCSHRRRGLRVKRQALVGLNPLHITDGVDMWPHHGDRKVYAIR